MFQSPNGVVYTKIWATEDPLGFEAMFQPLLGNAAKAANLAMALTRTVDLQVYKRA